MPGRVYSVEFNADGSRVVAGSSYNGTGEVGVHSYSRDMEKAKKVEVKGNRVVSHTSGEQLWKWSSPGGVYAVTFREDGKVVAACGFEGVVYLLDAADGKEIARFVPVPILRSSAL